jgi:hypothetical protein
VCPEFRDSVMATINSLVANRGNDVSPWRYYDDDSTAYIGAGLHISVTKLLVGSIPEGCIRVGFSVTTDSHGMEYTGVDWEAGPVGGGISSVAGDIFYAVVDGTASNRNFLWYEEADLGEDAGAWINGMSMDLADLSDNLNALDSWEAPPDSAGDPTGIVPWQEPLRRSGLELERNFPNPFRSRTTMQYALPHDARVRLAVYDVSGRRVASLVDAVQPAGRHGLTWDGRGDGGGRVPSGVYFARIEAAGQVQTRKVVMIR